MPENLLTLSYFGKEIVFFLLAA